MDTPLLEKARSVAFRYLGYTARSRAEMQQRLEKANFPPEIIEAVLAECEARGWINDAQFAQDWVADRADRKRYGRNRLALELRNKGVDAATVAEALSEVDSEAEYERALAAARPRWHLSPDDSTDPQVVLTEKRRLAQFLQRRGFSWDIITQVLSALVENTE